MEFITKESGTKVVLNPAGFLEAFRLKASIERALLKEKINIEEAIQQDLSGILIALDCSEDVLNNVFICLRKSTYGGAKITFETFEQDEAKADLYEILFYCLKVNIYPFFKPLLSRLGIELKEPTFGESPK